MVNRTFLQKRSAIDCPGCKRTHNVPMDYPGWIVCVKCGREIFWRDVKKKAKPLEPRLVIDE